MEFTTILIHGRSTFILPEVNVHMLVTNFHVLELLYLSLNLCSCFSDNSFEEKNNHTNTLLANDSNSRSFTAKHHGKEKSLPPHAWPYVQRLLLVMNQNWLSGN